MLLDASIIIDVLRAKDMRRLAQLKSLGGAVCGVTRAEILSGVRTAPDRLRLLAILDGFQQVAIPDAMWDEVGFLQSQLRANGITVALADAVLTVVALTLNDKIWSRDVDFQNVQRVVPALKLFREGP
jgi:predicted nucleic acid-binding protein